MGKLEFSGKIRRETGIFAGKQGILSESSNGREREEAEEQSFSMVRSSDTENKKMQKSDVCEREREKGKKFVRLLDGINRAIDEDKLIKKCFKKLLKKKVG